ncbi:MAG: DegT/DnrJ/EryC1/StrS family aminotransferase [Candidatus Abyssobacteria bacterium SURF_5]|uniref:GDP-perosamine synthase n=1 Tax=Abyssobacteria bacterium (strain SURF_5) TaxID=2093360 RepID=A0A3A4P2M9_ABYX5|nr:MAG: DegT/DnrJ/EryC1/StrS family aminotransferase [Candidatus Abyssubacteria bacterium SURF_5]
MKKKHYPVYEPLLGQEELDLLEECIRTCWISSLGRHIDLFERTFAKFCRCQCAAATSSGTAALHLALVALGIGRGDEVIVPDLTFVATANSVAYTGAKVILVDVEKETWTIDPELIKKAITRRTKAIVGVHLYGHPFDIERVVEIAREHDLKVIEDAAEAHGSLYKGKRVGPLADIGCFSFYGNKVITTGEGGMVVTNDPEVDARIRFLRDHSMDGKRRYFHPEIGYNYRMTNMQAAVGRAQMKRIGGILAAKRRVAKLYSERLGGIEGIVLPPERPWARSIFWLYTILIEKTFGPGPGDLAAHLRAGGIDTRPVFIPMHLLPMYGTRRKFPVSDMLSSSGLSLPSSPTLIEDDIDYICEMIRRSRR